jgi:hypothetical protein
VVSQMDTKILATLIASVGLLFLAGLFNVARCDEQIDVLNLPHTGILAVPRPSQIDGPLIETIAAIGVQQVVSFPPGSDVISFISDKCRKASETLLLHPTYWKAFVQQNPSAVNDNLSHTSVQKTTRFRLASLWPPGTANSRSQGASRR